LEDKEKTSDMPLFEEPDGTFQYDATLDSEFACGLIDLKPR